MHVEVRVAGQQFQVDEPSPERMMRDVGTGRDPLLDARAPGFMKSFHGAAAAALSTFVLRGRSDAYGRDMGSDCHSGSRDASASLIAHARRMQAGDATRNGG